MSDFDKERKAKRPPQEAAAGDDPWAKWRPGERSDADSCAEAAPGTCSAGRRAAECGQS